MWCPGALGAAVLVLAGGWFPRSASAALPARLSSGVAAAPPARNAAAPGAETQPGDGADDARDLAAADPARRLASIVRVGTRARPQDLRRLAPFLDAADSAPRLAAARVLVRAGNSLGLSWVTARAADPAAPVRFEALTILREAVSLPPTARHATERALADADPALRLLALDVLGLHLAADSVPAVIPALADGDRDVRLAATELLGRIPDRRALLPLLERADAPDRTERTAALRALSGFAGVHPRLQVGPAVSRQLNDTNEDVRLAAIEALGRLRWPQAVPALREIAARRPRDSAARRAALALGLIGDAAAVDALVTLLQVPGPAAEVVVALRTAGPMAVPAVVTVLRQGLSTSAVAAADILAAIGDPRGAPALADVLARGLSSTAGDPPGNPPGDPPGGGQESIALRTPRTASVIIAAARALGRLRAAGAVTALMAAVTDHQYAAFAGVRTACVEALAAIGDRRAAAVVEPASRDRDPWVRAAALRLGAALQAGISGETLAARIADPDPAVRAAAFRAAVVFPRALPFAALLAAALSTPEAAPLDEAAVSEALEAAVTEKDRPVLLASIARASSARRRLLFRALAALSPGKEALPRPLADSLIALLVARGGESSEAPAAAEALAASRLDETTVGALLRVLPAAPTADVRARICPALARARSPAADQALAHLLDQDPDDGVRAAAAWAARDRRSAAPIAAALARALRTGPAEVAANASTALAAAADNNDRSQVWVRVRLLAWDGSPLPRHWIRVEGRFGTLRARTDDRGEAVLTNVPSEADGYHLWSADGADAHNALTAAMASGRSPATTPVGP